MRKRWRHDKPLKDKLLKDKLLKDKLLKIKTSEIQTPKYQIQKNVSQFIFNLAAALDPESVIT